MKLAIITGASSGIGLATAKVFLAQGFHVINISRRSANTEGIEDRLCDLADNTAIQTIATQLIALVQESQETCLVHNACRMKKDSADNCDSSDMAVTLAINLLAPNSLNQCLLPVMPSGSSVIYIGSTLSEKAVANAFSYVTSKHASVGMMRASCQDMIGRGIHSCCICPGFTNTEMLRTHIGDNPQIMQDIAAMNSFGRMIEPLEIANFISWAHTNPVINGSVLHAHLGQKES